MKNKKETPIYVLQYFKCPNCGSKKHAWQQWGFDGDLETAHPWFGQIQFTKCGEKNCSRIIPSHLAFESFLNDPYEKRKEEWEKKFKKVMYEPNMEKLGDLSIR